MKTKTKKSLLTFVLCCMIIVGLSSINRQLIKIAIYYLGVPSLGWAIVIGILTGCSYMSWAFYFAIKAVRLFCDVYEKNDTGHFLSDLKKTNKQFLCKHKTTTPIIHHCPSPMQILEVKVICDQCGLELDSCEEREWHLMGLGMAALIEKSKVKFAHVYAVHELVGSKNNEHNEIH